MADNKILRIDDFLDKQKKEGQPQKVVLCYGHFNVIHPGHLRFLNFAKTLGGQLVVAIENFSHLSGTLIKERYFDQIDRAKGIANLSLVDYVLLLDEGPASAILKLRPSIYVKGREFQDKLSLIRDEVEAADKVDTRIVFSSGDVNFAPNLLTQNLTPDDRVNDFISVCERQGISLVQTAKAINQFSKLHFAVIGDTIVDHFVSCDSLGISSEAPVQVLRELESRDFIGGAAIVACHLKTLGARCDFLSVVGNDSPGKFIREQCEGYGVDSLLIADTDRPTTFKIRYMVNDQKLLRVSRLKQNRIPSRISDMLIKKLWELGPTLDGILISDFNYGLITDEIIDQIVQLKEKFGLLVVGDTQSSSQIGVATKFTNFDLVTPTEKEVRIALGDFESGLETIAHEFVKVCNVKNLLITLGADGALAYYQDRKNPDLPYISEYFPALVKRPIDVAGAGDALLTGTSLALASKMDILTATAIGSVLAAISVNRLGNTPISVNELKD